MNAKAKTAPKSAPDAAPAAAPAADPFAFADDKTGDVGDAPDAPSTMDSASASVDAALNAENVAGDKSAEVAAPRTATAQKFMAKRPVFILEDDVPMPDSRRGKRDAIYPFNTMTIGQRFFVPATDENPEPWRNMASIASRAGRTYWPKQYESRRIDADESKNRPAGAGVWRVADGVGDLPEAKRKAKKEGQEAS